jgi:hypothetical protein
MWVYRRVPLEKYNPFLDRFKTPQGAEATALVSTLSHGLNYSAFQERARSRFTASQDKRNYCFTRGIRMAHVDGMDPADYS